MPALVTPRHEHFAQGLANGLRQIDAYVNAGYGASASSASQLAREPQIAQRVQELMEDRAAAMTQAEEEDGTVSEVVDKAWLIKQCQQNIKKAQINGQINAANKAIELLMDLVGLAPKKGVAGEPDPRTAKPATHEPRDLGDVLKRISDMNNFPDDSDSVDEPADD